jgi:hypothetical protein
LSPFPFSERTRFVAAGVNAKTFADVADRSLATSGFVGTGPDVVLGLELSV